MTNENENYPSLLDYNNNNSNTIFNQNKNNNSSILTSNNINSNKCFKNLTNIHIPDNVIEVVSLGPKYNKIKKNINKKDSVDIVKSLENTLKNLYFDTDTKIKSDQV